MADLYVPVLGPMSNYSITKVGALAKFADAIAASLAVITDAAARFLLQVQPSASDADMATVRSKGYAACLSEQLRAPASQPVSQSGLDWLDARGQLSRRLHGLAPAHDVERRGAQAPGALGAAAPITIKKCSNPGAGRVSGAGRHFSRFSRFSDFSGVMCMPLTRQRSLTIVCRGCHSGIIMLPPS